MLPDSESTLGRMSVLRWILWPIEAVLLRCSLEHTHVIVDQLRSDMRKTGVPVAA